MTLVCLLTAVIAALCGVPPPPARALRRRLPAGDPPRTPRTGQWLRRLTLALVAVAVLIGLGARFGGRGVALTLASMLVLVTTTWVLRMHRNARRARRAQIEVAKACTALAAHLRIGRVPQEALAAASRDCPILLPARQTWAVGGDVAGVWHRQARQPGHAGLAELARAWQVGIETGAPLAVTLDQVATTLSSDQTLRAVVAGELAAPRASSKLMAALPVCGIAMGYVIGGDPLHWLIRGPAGWACVVVGVVLACAGVVWIELLARQAAADT